jgi:signal transduction histidine kinase
MAIFTSSFAEGDSGELLIATLDGIRKLVNEQAGAYLVRAGGQHSKFGKLLRDRDGGLWVGTYDGGLLHLYRRRIDRFTHSDGLSGDSIRYLFEDREGSIWVGTRDGLDRFREFAVPSITEKQGLSNSFVGSILHARDGSIWLGTLNGLDRWKNGDVTVYGNRDGIPDPYVLSLFEDQAGRIWVTTRRGMVYLERGKFVPVPNFPAGSVVCIVGDNAGGIWISAQGTLFHLEGPSVVEEIPWTKLGHQDYARIILPDSARGGLWLGFRRGGVAYYKDHSIRLSYGREQGFGEGQVSGLKLDDDGTIWAATGGGLKVIRAGRTFRLSSANGLPCDIVHWVVEDNDHFFWLYTACGLARIARSELERWVADPKRTVNTRVLDNTDGVRSNLTPTDSNPIVAKSADGKIWFLPRDGVSVIDPHHLPFNNVLPPVHIERIIADDKLYDLKPGMRLPANVRHLSIDYTALSLGAPEKVHFRYKLEREDQDWTEVVNDREVQYTNLAPRKHVFRVMASNDSGLWNETGDTLEFWIDPAFYQTTWFYASCVAAFFAMLWGLHRLRVYQIRREFDAQLDGRVGERLRVARELHDTLLQSFQASLIQMQAARNVLGRRPERAEQSLDKAITTAAGAVAEGRDAIQNLRGEPSGEVDLAKLLTAAGQELSHSDEATENPPAFRVTVEGEQQNLQPLLQDEVYRIARELLRNAFRHAQAGKIETEIRYETRQLRVHVRDDGKGIDPEILKFGGRAGHWGLPGMRERVDRLGGKLEFWSDAGAGTEAVLTVPAAVAYGVSYGGRLSFLRRKKAAS